MGRHLYTLKKQERLAGKKIIDELFNNGKTGRIYPVKYIFTEKQPGEYPVSVAFSVSKKNFRHAIDRNLLKRRMKEAYRLNKQEFYTKLHGNSLAVMFIYVANEILPYSKIEKSMKQIPDRLAKKVIQ